MINASPVFVNMFCLLVIELFLVPYPGWKNRGIFMGFNMLKYTGFIYFIVELQPCIYLILSSNYSCHQ